MGHPLRAIDPDHGYHVTCRGNNREQLVWDRYDCETFCAELDLVATKFEWEVYASCLMPNHHHVVLRAAQDQFSAGFQQLNGNYARRTNRRHGRTDHLFRNRPRALELAGTAHLVGALAYVLRNPLKAHLVEHAASWPWSSYRATAGLEPAPPWLLVDEVLELFGRDRRSAVATFEQLVHSGHLSVSDDEEMPSPGSEPEPRAELVLTSV